MNDAPQFHDLRSSSGFTLATVLIIGLTATLLVTAMFGAVLPSFQKTSAFRSQTALRNSAEAGLDWAVGQYNLDAGKGSGLDGPLANLPYADVTPSDDGFDGCKSTCVQDKTDPNHKHLPGSPGPLTSLPTNLANYNSLDNFTSTVTLQAFAVQPTNTSAVYDKNVALQNPAVPPIDKNFWRVITATATSPGGAHSRQVQVVLKPQPPTPNPLVGIMANSGQLKGSIIDAYNSDPGTPLPLGSMGADVDVNTTIDISGAEIHGNLTIREQPPGNKTTNYNVASSKTHVYGDTISNGLIDTAKGKALFDGTETESASKTQFTMPVVPLHPGTASEVPGSGVIDKSNSKLGTSGKATEWFIDDPGLQMDLNGGGSFTAEGSMKLYLEGGAKAPGGALIAASGKGGEIGPASGRPKDLIIYYNGTNKLDFSGLAVFKGVIVAPNADVIFSGNAQIYGAVIGNLINTNGGGSTGGIHYDISLGTINLFPTQTTYNAVTWRELGGN